MLGEIGVYDNYILIQINQNLSMFWLRRSRMLVEDLALIEKGAT